MSREITERDWKVFRELREVALERYCQQVLEDVGGVVSAAAKSAEQRYHDVYDLIKRRDRDLQRTFDSLRRSTALYQLAGFAHQGLLTAQELTRFSPETREWISGMLRQISA